MDINMPLQDGWETTQIIRKNNQEGLIPYVKIIANTAHSEKELLN